LSAALLLATAAERTDIKVFVAFVRSPARVVEHKVFKSAETLHWDRPGTPTSVSFLWCACKCLNAAKRKRLVGRVDARVNAGVDACEAGS
jgi:hypothetical protein